MWLGQLRKRKNEVIEGKGSDLLWEKRTASSENEVVVERVKVKNRAKPLGH